MRFLYLFVFALLTQSAAHAQEVDFCDGVIYKSKDCTNDCRGYGITSDKWFSCMNLCHSANKRISDANDAQRRCDRNKKDAEATERRKQLENEAAAKKAKANTYTATDEERERVSERFNNLKKERAQKDIDSIEQYEQDAKEKKLQEFAAKRRKKKQDEAAARELLEMGGKLLGGGNNPSATYGGSGGRSGCGSGPYGGCP